MKKSTIKKCTAAVAAALITGTVTAVGGIGANLRYIDNMTTAFYMRGICSRVRQEL